MESFYKKPSVTPNQLNAVLDGSTAFSTLSTVGSLSAGQLELTDAVLVSGGNYIGTGIYVTLTINGSALLLPLYQPE